MVFVQNAIKLVENPTNTNPITISRGKQPMDIHESCRRVDLTSHPSSIIDVDSEIGAFTTRYFGTDPSITQFMDTLPNMEFGVISYEDSKFLDATFDEQYNLDVFKEDPIKKATKIFLPTLRLLLTTKNPQRTSLMMLRT